MRGGRYGLQPFRQIVTIYLIKKQRTYLNCQGLISNMNSDINPNRNIFTSKSF